jgi:hypothetical protein
VRCGIGQEGQVSAVVTYFPENELCEGSFIKHTAFVNPATILGPHLIPVPGAGIGLKHDGSIGFQHPPLGFINGLAERRTY